LLKNQREIELKIATNAFEKKTNSKSLKAAKDLKEVLLKDAKENLALKEKTLKL